MTDAAISILQVENLLSQRKESWKEDFCPSLEQAAVSLERTVWKEVSREKLPVLEECRLSNEMIALFYTIRDEELFEQKLPVAANRNWIWWMAAAVCLVVLSAGVAVRIQNSEPSSTMTAKGMTHDFRIAVSRNGEQFPLHAGEVVETGDHLGFFYTAPTEGYLAVFFLDESGSISSLYPSMQQRTAQILAGASIPLPDGAIVTPSKACEWIVAVFSDESRALDSIRQELMSTMKVDGDCRVHFALQSASRVRVQQIRKRGGK